MGIATILAGYQARLVALHAASLQLRSGQLIAMIAMSVPLCAILVLGFLAIARRSLPPAASLAPHL